MKKTRRFFLIGILSLATGVFLASCSPGKNSAPTAPLAVVPAVILDTPTPKATCSTAFTKPTPIPDLNSLIPPVSGADFSIGPADAPVTLIEYCDFQSDGCKALTTVVDTLLQTRSDLRFVFRPFPLIGILDKSDKAMTAALAADQQGKFWEMYNLLYAKHDQWIKLPPNDFNAWVIREAAAAGMDSEALTAAIDAPETTTRMMSAYEAARKINIPSVPIVLINGGLQPSYLLDYQNLNDTVALIALGKKQFSTCPPFAVDAQKQYIATIRTEKGDIVIQLFPDKAPLAVNSFVFLARQGWFNGVTFHLVIPGAVAQSGDPSGTGLGNPGYYFNSESTGLKYDVPGRVGMANSGPDTNGSQFFITFTTLPQLDDKYTVFGQVISGLEVAESLTPRDTSQNPLAPLGDRIISVEIEEK